MQRHSVELGAFDDQCPGRQFIPEDLVAAYCASRIHHPARDFTKWLPHTRDRSPLRECRPADDSQSHTHPWRACLLRPLADSAFAAVVVAPQGRDPGSLSRIKLRHRTGLEGSAFLPVGAWLAAAMFSAALAATAARRKQRSLATWCFSAGMLAFALESLFGAIANDTLLPERAAFWQTLSLVARSFLPGIWLTFSLTYSRANYRDFLVQSRWLLLGAFLVPMLSLAALYSPFFYVVTYEQPVHGWGLKLDEPAKILNVLILISTVLILTNIERTFRAAVGTMRWRIKFLVLGLAVIFGACIYTRSQALLFSDYSPSQLSVEATALLIGCALITVAYVRGGFGEIDVYPSRAVLHTSITVLLTGAYLFVVGVLAQIVARFGGAASFPIAAFVVLLGVAILAVLLLSDRARQSLQLFVSRHFKRPQHDFRQIWARFTQSLSIALDETALATIASRLISETFGALSVSTWLFDEHGERLMRVSSTSNAEQAPSDDSLVSIE